MVFCLSGLQPVSNGKVQTMFPDFAPRLSEAAGGTHAAASLYQAEPTRTSPVSQNLHCTALSLTHTDHLDTTLEEAGANLEVGRVARELCWLRREMGRLVAAPLW